MLLQSLNYENVLYHFKEFFLLMEVLGEYVYRQSFYTLETLYIEIEVFKVIELEIVFPE